MAYYLVVYLISMGVIILIGFYAQQQREAKYADDASKIDVRNVTVVIPFRNERERLSVLLKSINELTRQPAEFVFVDDHSTDDGAALIRRELSIQNYRILTCPEDTHGKKEALRYAIEQVEGGFILTMDADVHIPQRYFERLSELGEADMYVLPAIMKADNFVHGIYEIDLVLVNAANAGLAGLSRPIMASGANLLYCRDTFMRVNDYNSHAHAASGDDTYLLRDFRKHDCDVRLHTDPEIAVFTETPQSFREFIDQRLRWIGKTADIRDHLSTTLALFQAFLTGVFVLLCLFYAYKSDYDKLIAFYGIKTVLDMILFFPYFNRIGRLKNWWFIPVYELLFPVYTFIIIVLVPFYKPKWKGREIYT